MPQEFHVLRCFSCETFQVHIVKKTKKWECKMCGAKQSFKQNYGKGSAKDCRAHVMKLNELRYMKANPEGDILNDSSPDNSNEFLSESTNEFQEILINESVEPKVVEKKPLVSKWADFLDEPEPEESDEEDMNLLNGIIKKKRKQNSSKKTKDNKNKKICSETYENIPQDVSQNLYQSPHKVTSIMKKNETSQGFSKSEVTKSSKYSKYLDEDASESNTGFSSIFNKNLNNSDLSLLDNELNF